MSPDPPSTSREPAAAPSSAFSGGPARPAVAGGRSVRVVLTGSFNNWNQSQLLFAREGDEWVCRVDLDPGVYQYKFIVDGDWLLDPSNPDTAEDEAGNVNNVIEVKGQ